MEYDASGTRAPHDLAGLRNQVRMILREAGGGAADIARLRAAAEHAPATAGSAPGLLGWWLTAGDGSGLLWVCAGCAARILARGCALGERPEPVWSDRAEPRGVCVVCGR